MRTFSEWASHLLASVLLIGGPTRAPVLVVQRSCRKLTKRMFDPYRPELHYMRGPGPKWREKWEQAGRAE